MAKARNPFTNPFTTLVRDYRHWQKLDERGPADLFLSRIRSSLKKRAAADKSPTPSKHAAEFDAMKKLMLKGRNVNEATLIICKNDSRKAAALRRAWYREQPK